MSRPTLRILAYLTLAAGSIGRGEAGVGDMSGGARSLSRHFAPVQTVQSGDCWYDNGWNGPGYYPCGNEWNSRPDMVGPIAPIIVPVIRRRHRHGVVVAHPQAPKPIYPGAPSPRLGAGVPPGHFHGGVGPPAIGASGVSPGWRRFAAGGARVSPNFHPGAAIATPGFAGGGFHGGLGGGNFHRFHNAGVPHLGGPVFPGFTGAGGFHPGRAIGTPHIGAPASLGFAGVGAFHAGGRVGAPYIGAPVSRGLPGGGFRGFAGAGNFHGPAGAGVPRVAAPASAGVAGPAIPSGAGRH